MLVSPTVKTSSCERNTADRRRSSSISLLRARVGAALLLGIRPTGSRSQT
jgi:hypothetical protein